jgi:chemotaxis protein MotB
VKRLRKSFEDDENLDRWLLTYADLITLLLAFFIVMYSMSQIDAKRFGRMAEALNGVLRGGDMVVARYRDLPTSRGHGILKLGDLKMLQTRLQEELEERGRQEEVITEITERGLVIHIVESALFRQGSADLEPRALEILDRVAATVSGMPNHVRVEGHTDDRPIHTERFPSNWELSAARATEVVRYFIESHGIESERISALGYGEYRPIRLNTSAENRAKNRRVDVVVLTMELSLKEPSSQLYDLSGEQ